MSADIYWQATEVTEVTEVTLSADPFRRLSHNPRDHTPTLN